MNALERGVLWGGAFLGMASLSLQGLPTVPGVVIENPDWSIIMTPEGYADVALDKRPGFDGREYLSGEWAAAIFYTGGSNPPGPIWLRKSWGFPCWDTNANFAVITPISLDDPAVISPGLLRFYSVIGNGDVEITIRYEMLDTTTGIDQGEEKASGSVDGSSSTSNRYVLQQSYSVKNVSGGPLTNVRFYHFLHGLRSGISLYDDRVYPGALSAFRFDNTQSGTSQSLHDDTGAIYSHDDTMCMHAMDVPLAIECGYYGKEGVDDHINGKPSVGVHLSIEADSLNGPDYFYPPEGRWVSGGMCFAFPDLANGVSHDITMLLSILTQSTFVAPPPEINIISAGIVGSDYVIDFEKTTEAPLDGFILRSSKDMSGTYPDDWPQVLVPRFIDVPYPGASRYTIPINTTTNPKCFFRIDPFVQ